MCSPNTAKYWLAPAEAAISITSPIGRSVPDVVCAIPACASSSCRLVVTITWIGNPR
ncbi:Uncharacterised protein [Mycobacteroides abscessus subsp. abscessus]|nr:Uncharacterised protein [Mycobacteroides abscessus subsp. abscessus]